MRSKQITKPIVRQLEQDDGTLTADDSETANNIQDFFTSVFTGEDIKNTPDIVNKKSTSEMKDIFIRPGDVLEKMEKLKENTAQELTKFTLKYGNGAVTLFLCLYVCYLINPSVNQG